MDRFLERKRNPFSKLNAVHPGSETVKDIYLELRITENRD